MSLKRLHEGTCPFCHEKQDITLWDYLNTHDDPGMKAQALNGDLFNIPCNHCGRVSRFAYPMIYQDPQRHLVVGMVPERSQENAQALLNRLQCSDLVGPRMRGYTVRGVTQPGELSEKITIAENALDDRVVELYKLIIREHFSGEMGREPDHVFLHEAEKLHFLLISDETDDVYAADFIPENYEEVRNRFAAFFPQGVLRNVFVDKDWVQQVLKPVGTAH